jgi:hypothetical protein
MANLTNPKRRTIAVNASGGALVLISASTFTGYVEIQESAPGSETGGTYAGGAFVGQGLTYQRADEAYANTYPLTPGAILQFGDAIRKNESIGCPSWTYADGSVRPATPFIKVISATAVASNVEVREWRQGIN